MSPKEYAVFPGTEAEKETIIYAKIADRWEDFGTKFKMTFREVLSAPIDGDVEKEPVLVHACLMKEGGVRRSNHFRAMRVRKDTP